MPEEESKPELCAMNGERLVTHDLARGNGIVLITCGICYCAVVERFWDKHLQRHAVNSAD